MLFNHLESLENHRKKGLNKLSVFEMDLFTTVQNRKKIFFLPSSNNKEQNKYFEEGNLDYYF